MEGIYALFVEIGINIGCRRQKGSPPVCNMATDRMVNSILAVIGHNISGNTLGNYLIFSR